MNPTLSPLHLSAQQTPNAAAINVWDGQQYICLTYLELSQKVCAIANQIKQQGLKEGDRLACIDNNSVELIVLYWACIDTGVLFCPLSGRFPQQQIAELAALYRFSHFWASTAFCAKCPDTCIPLDFSADALSPAPTVNLESPCNAILTSGSSGQPKAAVHCLANHIASAQGSSQLIELTQDDNWLLSLPLFHIGGLAIVNRCAVAGAALTIAMTGVDMVEQLSEIKLTHLSLVSTQLVRILRQDANALQNIKALLLGGGAISSTLLEQLKPLNINTYTSYGMTEMSSQITTGLATTKGSSGKLLPNRQLKIVDHAIYVKGDTLFLGYLTFDGQSGLWRELDKDGWFATKDLGYWDQQDDLVITGRADNMFICGGENIQPEEVEAALKRHPMISDAIVFPMKDSEFGLLPAAIVQGELPDEAELERFISQTLARFKRPRYYLPWPEVETTSLKVSRKQIIQAALHHKENP
ncbi:o-succinylbenzoate--CoA ligase [Shewanella colwelliana]|uniref:o-succinylbenzoate--CoA ligase n=1 Tax=Shewanella colwelliana TaxID=23 RepID=UPI003D05EDC1